MKGKLFTLLILSTSLLLACTPDKTPWDAMGFDDIYDLNFTAKVASKFNGKDIINKTTADTIIKTEDGHYVFKSLDYFASLHDELMNDEHLINNQEDLNKFTIEYDQENTDSYSINIYILSKNDDTYQKQKLDTKDLSFNKDKDSIEFTLKKQDGVDGYCIDLETIYILKDVRGFIYFTSAVVLFN